MSYHDTVGELAQDAEQMEQVYRTAIKAGEADAFKEAIDEGYRSAPENLLYAAWFHRLQHAAVRAKGFAIAWGWVIPLAIINGLLFWWLSDDRYVIRVAGLPGTERDFMPAILMLAAPLSAVLVLTFLAVVERKRWRLAIPIGIVLLGAAAYVLWVFPQAGTRPFQEQYLTLMSMHLPLLAWAGVGVYLIVRHRDPANRFAFLIKSLEIFVLGGLFVGAGSLFTGISFGLFQALDVDLPDVVQRLFFAGGGGLIPVIATAVIYHPGVPPVEQSFDEGLSKVIALLMRILLPLTLLVLLVYLAFIPFHFWAPFENRDVLIIYNGMLFAVVALVIGATPVSQADMSPNLRRWLRRGLIAVSALALIVSLYALSAILYRTVLDRLTPNRLAFIGWNVVNIGLLLAVLFLQVRAGEERWRQRLYYAYSAGTVAYAVWTLVVVLALPWLFGIDQGQVQALPTSVQEIIYEEPAPVLLKCEASPHIYLLERGTKRWIEDIETFEERGYVWRDVEFVSCQDLRAVPDGVPIPSDAGSPPQP